MRSRDGEKGSAQGGWTEASERNAAEAPLEYAFSFDEMPGGMPSKVSAPRVAGALDPQQLARAVEQGLLMRVRVGRVGRDGKMVSLRVKGRHGPLDITISREGGTLTLTLGDEDPELSGRIEQALREFSDRAGIALEVE